MKFLENGEIEIEIDVLSGRFLIKDGYHLVCAKLHQHIALFEIINKHNITVCILNKNSHTNTKDFLNHLYIIQREEKIKKLNIDG